MIRELGVALPYWLDRPDEEAVEIAVAAEQAAIETVWVGEMASYAFALATAIGLKTERVRRPRPDDRHRLPEDEEVAGACAVPPRRRAYRRRSGATT